MRIRWSFPVILLVLFSVVAAVADMRVVRVYKGSLNVNTASAADFGRLPGVGEVISYRIVKTREEGGAFREVRELKRIKGISERIYAGLKNYVSTKGENNLKVYIDLNTVTKSLLLGLPGMSAVEARSILNYRNSSGGFATVEELRRVPGVTAKRYLELAELLTVVR